MTTFNYDELLEAYKSLGKNRILATEHDAEATLKKTFMKELKDENSHPRVRTTPHVKFYLGTKRILNANLDPVVKIQLLQVYTSLMEQFLQEKQ